MLSKSLISLMLCFGATLCQTIANHTQIGLQSLSKSSAVVPPAPLTPKNKDSWNFGSDIQVPFFKVPSPDLPVVEPFTGGLFDKMFKQHNEAMDRAIAEHNKAMDMAFGRNGHFMDQSHDFNTDWDQLDKDIAQMFNGFDDQLSEMSVPFFGHRPEGTPREKEPIITPMAEKLVKGWSEKVKEVIEKEDKPKNETSQSGLPVFHPSEGKSSEQSSHELPQLIDKIMDGFRPVLDHINKEVQQRINSTYEYAERGPPSDVNWEFLNDENSTELRDGSTEKSMFFNLFDNIFDSFANLGKLIGHEGEGNSTSPDVNDTTIGTGIGGDGLFSINVIQCDCPKAVMGQHKDDCPLSHKHNGQHMSSESSHLEDSFDLKLKIAYDIHALENVLMGNLTKVVYTDYQFDKTNLLNHGFKEEDLTSALDMILNDLKLRYRRDRPVGLLWTKHSVEVSEIRSDFYSKAEMLLEAVQRVVDRIIIEDMKAQEQQHSSSLPSIEQRLRQEIRIKSEAEDYEWYEWLIVGLIACTSSLLLLTTLVLCCQRTRRSKSVKLTPKGKGIDEPLGDKYKEKIKTIFVNLK